MIVVGLTGGIGTGKSTASDYLIGKGFAHIDADKIGWEITADGSPLLKELDQVFGPEGEMGIKGIDILDEKGSLNRKAMASVVFSDAAKTEKLNSIMFHRILSEINKRIDELKEKGLHDAVILDAPLLFEAGADKLCDSVILVTADKDIRIKRVCARDNATPEEVKQRIDKQMGEEEKASLADYIVDNSTDLDNLYENLEKIYKKVVDK